MRTGLLVVVAVLPVAPAIALAKAGAVAGFTYYTFPHVDGGEASEELFLGASQSGRLPTSLTASPQPVAVAPPGRGRTKAACLPPLVPAPP